MYKKVIKPDRLRQIPANFSWIDHRLVRHGHLKHLSPQSIAFYLFLVSVGDSQGLSYYSNSGISKLLNVKKVNSCREELIQADLVAYGDGIYQVLDLGLVTRHKKSFSSSELPSSSLPGPIRQEPTQSSGQNEPEDVGIPECLKKLLADLS